MVLDSFNGAWLAALFFGLGLFPGTWLTRRCRLPRWLWLPMVFGAASAIAYAEFWLFLFRPLHAATIASAVVLVSLGAFAVQLSDSRVRQWLRHRDIWLPAAMMLAVTVAYLAYLAWAGGASVTTRFEIPLALEDNLFPWWLADRVYYGYLVSPDGRIPPLTTMGLVVQSSDRPPLQTTVLLAVRNLTLFGPPGKLTLASYQVLTTVCQMVWVAVLYSLGRAMALSRLPLAFALAGAVFSGFFLLNSLYTWPKLFAAWLFLLALATFIHVARAPEAHGWRTWAIIGGASGLALLAHGGPAFSLLVLPGLLARRDVRRAMRLRHLLTAAIVALLFLAPWTAYQRLVDPPGNMLVKAHLAGVWVPDDRPVLRAIREAYSSLTVTTFLHNRWENVKEQWLVAKVSGSPAYVTQWQQFYHHLPALDALLVGLAACLLSRRVRAAERAPRWLVSLTWYALGTVVLWMLLLFSPGTALVHHGSYAATALLFFCGAAWLATLPGWIAGAMMIAHAGLFIGCWLAAGTVSGGPPPSWKPIAGIVMTMAFILFLGLLTAIPEPSPTEDEDEREKAADFSESPASPSSPR